MSSLRISVQILYGKLFFILGILWTFSFLHYMVHGDHSNSCKEYSTHLEIFFRMVDGLNLLRGFFMFLIFVCKKTVWSKVARVIRGKKEVERELTETQIFTTSA